MILFCNSYFQVKWAPTDHLGVSEDCVLPRYLNTASLETLFNGSTKSLLDSSLMVTPTAFSVPRDGHIYIDAVYGRCIDLISLGIWEGLTASRLRMWINNFETDEEQYFAACVLDALLYRPERQTLSLVKQLFQRTLPDLTRLAPTPLGTIDDFLDRFRLGPRQGDPLIRLVPVVREADPYTKSAPIIARHLKRHLRFDENWIIRAREIRYHISSGIRTFIFIDDFLGTGTQFGDFLRDENLSSLLPQIHAVYAPLIAHVEGISNLKSILHVAAVEVLDKGHSLFQSEAHSFDDGVNTPQSAREFYYKLLKRRGIDITGPSRRGFGHLELALAFQHAVPDNSLPILWWNESNWQPLFDR